MADPVILKTERLVLRPPLPGDADRITTHIGVKAVAWNLGRAPYPYARSDADEWLDKIPEGWVKDNAYVFAITLPDDRIVGCVGLDHKPGDVWEIGYWLGEPWWGLGYVTEASAAVMHWAETEKGFTRFVSGHFIDNPASGRVLLKLGFEPVGKTELFGRARGVKSPALRYTKGTEPDLALRLAAH